MSAVAAPVFLAGGWTLAQAAQPPGYDPVHETISALARQGLDHRWIMTLGLAGLGISHLMTSAGLRGVRPASRAVLGVAGLATALVAVFPQPAHGSAVPHEIFAAIGFISLALWPATTSVRGGPAVLRPAVAVSVSVLSSALLIWFAITLGGGPVGVSERVLALQQALWPLTVVVLLRGWRHAAR